MIIAYDVYAFATAASTKNSAAFMTLFNSQGELDRIIRAESNVAEIIELHETIIDDDSGRMMMRKIKDIDLPDQEEVFLEPTGLHIMLIKLKKPLVEGETFPMTLFFEKEKPLAIDVTIVKPGHIPKQMNQDHSHDHEHSHH
ncbi:MAG: copper chaperone PCu(A)C [Pseudomonadota bacterium]